MLPNWVTSSRFTSTLKAGRLLGLGGEGSTDSVSPKPVAGAGATGPVMAPLLSNVMVPLEGAARSSESYTSHSLSVAVFWKYRVTGTATPWLSNTLIEVP